MAAPRSPATSRRWLAEQLRKLRENKGLAQKDAAQACGWSGAKLSYLESGQRPVLAEDLVKLLPLYDVPQDQRELFYSAVEDAQSEGWWERFEHLMSDYQPAFIGLEQGSASIRSYEPVLIPGILQTARYAAAIMQSGARRRSAREVERLVEIRTSRQAILTRESAPTQLDVVLDESVLWRSPREEGVLTEQLEHLIAMADLPNVTLHVVPLRHGVQSFSAGPFAILSFPDDQPDPVVHLEHRGGALWIEDFESVERYELVFEGLVDLALDSGASLAMVREAIERQQSD
jgi:transcriptional regulator with XRE-family HTH domain